MTEEVNGQAAPAPAENPEAQAAPVPPQPAYAAPQPMPQPMPQPVPQPMYAPPMQPLMQLSGGMKFGWFVIGALMGIPGMLLAWLTNVSAYPQVKSDAVKFAVIGFVVNIVFWILAGLFFGTVFTVAMVGLVDSLNYYY